jgi:hypothetical protein
MEPYRSYFPLTSLWLQETEKMSKRVLVLPTGAAVDGEMIQTIGDLVRLAVSHGREVRDLLQKNLVYQNGRVSESLATTPGNVLEGASR